MKPYWVEGFYLNRKVLSKVKRRGQVSLSDVEPFTMTIWASSTEEALQLATQELGGGEWIEAPKISLTTEEQRMRAAGAPELPLFSPSSKKRKHNH